VQKFNAAALKGEVPLEVLGGLGLALTDGPASMQASSVPAAAAAAGADTGHQLPQQQQQQWQPAVLLSARDPRNALYAAHRRAQTASFSAPTAPQQQQQLQSLSARQSSGDPYAGAYALLDSLSSWQGAASPGTSDEVATASATAGAPGALVSQQKPQLSRWQYQSRHLKQQRLTKTQLMVLPKQQQQ
jgi:hypothetical protein